MENPFSGLSHQDLQDSLLRRLNEIANLSRDIKWRKDTLKKLRDDLEKARTELAQIQHCLSLEKVIPFQKVIEVSPIPEVETTFRQKKA